ncbi:MAG TPA: prepilin peptidase [Nevskiaceae bacterium]|nr:prepilin peptidase [Nevskiaceae bacterium]
MPQTAASIALGLWAGSVAWFDFTRRRIPNALLILALVPAVLAVGINGRGLLGAGVVASAQGLLVGGLPLLPGYAMGQMGAGDVKFSACIGLLLGPRGALEMLLVAAVALGLTSAGVLLASRGGLRRHRIATGPMLAGAFGVQLLWGQLLLS